MVDGISKRRQKVEETEGGGSEGGGSERGGSESGGVERWRSGEAEEV